MRQRNAEYDRANARAWYRANKDRSKAKTMARRASHPDEWKAYMREYRKKNRERLLAKMRDWKRRHKQETSAYNAKYLKENWKKPEFRKSRCEQSARWGKANRPLRNFYAKRNRAKRLMAAGSHTHEQWLAKLAYYGYRCYYCKQSLRDVTPTEDHAIPISRGGSDFIANILPACGSCNCKKHCKTWREFISEREVE